MTRTEAIAGALRASVVYLRPGFSFERTVLLPEPATVGAAIEASGLLREAAELAGCELEVGVFSQRRTLADPLHDGDRIEIYRPLRIEPKEARRIRVQIQRGSKAGKPLEAG
jgi:putative ubiquitin-RnfH superfamily antitoxin RatB of RatAB toxin-antitoxin module